jgi:glyoxylase-like metal-dependent hydrolase (beta-lactamase superfamily II)
VKTTKITDDVIQLKRLHFVNAYLVREPDGFTLVDTTIGKAAGELVAAAREAGGEIRRIAITHGHSDHVGALDALRAQLGDGVEVLMGEADARILAGDTFTTYGRTEIPNRFGQRFPLATMGTQDRVLVVESARALRALDPAVLVCGHGPALSSPAQAMDAAIARAGGR